MCMAESELFCLWVSQDHLRRNRKNYFSADDHGEPLTANQGGETNTLSKSGKKSFHYLAPVQHA